MTISEMIKMAMAPGVFGALRNLRRATTKASLERVSGSLGFNGVRHQDMREYAPYLFSGPRGINALADVARNGKKGMKSLADRAETIGTLVEAGSYPARVSPALGFNTYKKNLASVSDDADAWTKMKGLIREEKTPADLKTQLLSGEAQGNRSMDDPKNLQALRAAREDFGMRGVDTGEIENPNVFVSMTQKNAWPTVMRHAGFDRLHGTALHSAVRPIKSDVLAVARKNAGKPWDKIAPAHRDALMAGGLRDGVDLASVVHATDYASTPKYYFDRRLPKHPGFDRDLSEFDAGAARLQSKASHGGPGVI